MAEGETEWQREIQMQMQMQVGMGVAVGEPIALMARRKPAKDRPNDQKPKPKKRRPHPLAGRSGEGAPIAPPGWLWKAGRRATDMYFCSPTGEKFRAKHLLRAYLDTLPNPPPFGLFRFTIKANEFKDMPLPGVPPEDVDPSDGKKRKSHDIWRSNKKRKPYVRRKLSEIQSQENLTSDSILKLEGNFVGNKGKGVQKYKKTMSSPQNAQRLEQESHLAAANKSNMFGKSKKKMLSLHNVQHLEQKFHVLNNKNFSKKRLKKKSSKLFSQLLAAPTSYHVLSKDATVLRMFLDEAEKLKEKSEEEISELRNILLNRRYLSTRLGRYPDKVLRVFFSLLRNQDAPLSIGKNELIELCSKWSCKHKNYWCLLETKRINLFKKQLLKAEKAQMDPCLLDLIEASNENEDEGEVLDTPFSHKSNSSKDQRMEGNYNQNQEILEDLNRPFSATIDGMTAEIVRNEVGHQVNGDFDDLATRLARAINGDSFILTTQSGGQNVSLDKRLLSSNYAENAKIAEDFGSNIEASYRQIQSQIFGNLGENTGLGDREIIVAAEELGPDHVASSNACHPKETAWKECSDIALLPQEVKDGADIKPQDKKLKGSDGPVQSCGCQICLRDSTFCFGCACSFCRTAIQHKENWTFTKCPICNHLCHLECALKSRRAGVVPELGLDGEYLCPCCLEKSDLVPFWRDRVKDALSCIDMTLLQKHVTSAILVLNGTHREKYENIHRSVMELHDTLLYNTPCPDLHAILHDIQEKMDNCAELQNHMGNSTGADAKDAILKEEEKLSECRKKAALDFVEWLSAEKNADTQRSFLRDVTELVKKAEENVSMKADRAKTSRDAVKKVEKQLCLMKRSCSGKALSLEQLENQRAALDLELSELDSLQEKVSTITSELQESSARQYSSLLEEVENQRKRVLATKARLEEMASTINFFT
ncbi:hypothetical protein O6H91_18G037700 [Diphasiastrum complanatum]|uniref:Uncharacterized protein n=1 Tax=Diphasiastrum complanatum TaxID=34168 RepID=A0ACC2B000_DIPCM|nr:hypothetical protein O6H91_18G037700 [Diphasiastrum complanatum]